MMKNSTTKEKLRRLFLWIIAALCLSGLQALKAQEYSISSYQVTDKHRFEAGYVGGFWGHHLGHMVRTRTRGLWYVDDTGNDVNINPAINYLHFDGTQWILVTTLANPAIIQQNDASLAVGDTIYSYGVNVMGGYIEEAIFDSKTNIAVYNRKIRSIGASTNYIGAAVSPSGTRVVWWTKVVDNSAANGPCDWVYMYNTGSGWSDTIISKIPANDLSYVFASFLNDSVFYVGGELPSGTAPNWTYAVGAGKVVLGSPIVDFTVMKGSNIAANDLWVNRSNGDAHLFTYGAYGMIGYFYKPANGVWTDTVTVVKEIGDLSRWRFIDSPDGNLYLILSQGGFSMMVIPKSSISGKIDFSGLPIIPINNDDGFTASYAIWAEIPEYQTTPVGGVNFAYPGNDYAYANLLRHVSIAVNDGSVLIDLKVPNGNETFQGNATQKITWYALKTSGIDTVKIELSTNSGTTWSTIAAKAPNYGYYVWQVPPITSTTCLIRLSNPVNSTVYDVCNAPFTIQYTPVVLKNPVATLLEPAKDTSVVANATFHFKGTATASNGYIVNYVWNMGDGKTIHGIVPEFYYSYDAPGKDTVSFTVQDNNNLSSSPVSIVVTVTGTSDVHGISSLPGSWKVLGNYPNPFNGHTIFRYQAGGQSSVRINVFDVLGNHVATLFDGVVSPGEHSVSWTPKDSAGNDLSSGIYFIRFETPSSVSITKALLLR